jgi:hypothetical protein
MDLSFNTHDIPPPQQHHRSTTYQIAYICDIPIIFKRSNKGYTAKSQTDNSLLLEVAGSQAIDDVKMYLLLSTPTLHPSSQPRNPLKPRLSFTTTTHHPSTHHQSMY